MEQFEKSHLGYPHLYLAIPVPSQNLCSITPSFMQIKPNFMHAILEKGNNFLFFAKLLPLREETFFTNFY